MVEYVCALKANEENKLPFGQNAATVVSAFVSKVTEFPYGMGFSFSREMWQAQNQHIARVRRHQNLLPCACDSALTRLLTRMGRVCPVALALAFLYSVLTRTLFLCLKY